MARRKKKITAKEARSILDHEAFLTKMGVNSEQLRKKIPHSPKGKRLGMTPFPDYQSHQGTRTCSDNIIGSTAKRAEKVYTGDYITGFATMHKSNIVPVNRDADGRDYATMRRN